MDYYENLDKEIEEFRKLLVNSFDGAADDFYAGRVDEVLSMLDLMKTGEIESFDHLRSILHDDLDFSEKVIDLVEPFWIDEVLEDE